MSKLLALLAFIIGLAICILGIIAFKKHKSIPPGESEG